MVAAIFVAALMVVATTGRHAAAHSHLDTPKPMTTTHTCRVGGDPPMNCPGPCPTEPSVDWTSQATYERGGNYRVTWARNNHEGMDRHHVREEGKAGRRGDGANR